MIAASRMEEHEGLPPGTVDVDLFDGRFRYFWYAQLDDLDTGTWVSQVDAVGKSRSVDILEWNRVVRFEMRPTEVGKPTIELRPQPGAGITGFKFWQVDVPYNAAVVQEIVREVVGLQWETSEGTHKFYAIIDPSGRITLSPSPHV